MRRSMPGAFLFSNVFPATASGGRPQNSRRVPIDRKCIGTTEVDVTISYRADMLKCLDTLR